MLLKVKSVPDRLLIKYFAHKNLNAKVSDDELEFDALLKSCSATASEQDIIM